MIAVIIPVINEEQSIRQVIEEIPDLVDQVIVVDSGSTDRTVELAVAAGATVVQEPRRGYGVACLRGVQAARQTDVVVFLDGDHSSYSENISELVEPILNDQADLVVGSRLRGKIEPGAMPAHARLANILFSRILHLRFRVLITDIGPLRAIQTRRLLDLNMQEPCYGWTLEMMIKALKNQLRYQEIPVNYRKRKGCSKISGSLRASIKAGIRMFATLRYLWQ